jgi:hypothetical protein
VDLKSGKRWLTQCSKLTRRLIGKSVQKGTGRSLGTTKARGTSGMAKATEDDTHPASSAVGETESLSFGATAICSYCTAGLGLSNRSRKVSHNARLRSCIKRRVVLDPRRPTVLDFDQNPDAFAVERRFSPPNEQGVLWHLKAGIDRLTSSSSSHYS